MIEARSTPIEMHLVRNKAVWVKRDDLCVSPPFPPLGKVRGLDVLLMRLCQDGFRRVGVFESPKSQVGLALAIACKSFDELTPHVFFVRTAKRQFSRSAEQAGEYGAVLTPLQNNVLNVCYGQARRIVQSLNGYMVPFGFEHLEAKQAVSAEAQTIPHSLVEGGTLVVSAGSGVTVSSILNGLQTLPSRVIAVSTGRSRSKIEACIKRNLNRKEVTVEVVEPEFKYGDAPLLIAPFPCDPWYDLKAWFHLTRIADQLPEPILFWNVGA